MKFLRGLSNQTLSIYFYFFEFFWNFWNFNNNNTTQLLPILKLVLSGHISAKACRIFKFTSQFGSQMDLQIPASSFPCFICLSEFVQSYLILIGKSIGNIYFLTTLNFDKIMSSLLLFVGKWENEIKLF